MNKIIRLAIREYLAIVRTKGFIIGLILAPLLGGGSILITAMMEKNVDRSDKTIAVIDHARTIAPAIQRAAEARNKSEVFHEKTGKKLKPAYNIEVVKPDGQAMDRQRLELSDRVRAGQLHAFVEIQAEVIHPPTNSSRTLITYHSKNPALDDVRRWIASPINDEIHRQRLAEAGIDAQKVNSLLNWMAVEGAGLVTVDAKSGAINQPVKSSEAEAVLVPIITVMMMFMLLMMGATPSLQAVMEEKTQRIAEVMLGAVTPTQFMWGKLIGGVGVALTGSSVYLLVGGFTLASLALTHFMPYHVIPWFVVFLLLGVLMMGAILAALGSACNDPKDAQTLMLPAMLPMMFPLFVLVPIIKEPNGAFAVIMSFIPLFTPQIMTLRLGTQAGIPWWHPVVGLIGVILCTFLLVWLGGRIFRVGILLQGKPPRLSEIARWAIKG